MNGAIHAVVRSALDRGWSTFGVERAYAGLIEGERGSEHAHR